MNEVTAVINSPATTPAKTETVAEAFTPTEVSSEAEQLEALRLRNASIEAELTMRRGTLKAYRALLEMALIAYTLFLLLGPGLDRLNHVAPPGLRLSPYVWLYGLPYLWWLSTFVLWPPEGDYTPGCNAHKR